MRKNGHEALPFVESTPEPAGLFQRLDLQGLIELYLLLVLLAVGTMPALHALGWLMPLERLLHLPSQIL